MTEHVRTDIPRSLVDQNSPMIDKDASLRSPLAAPYIPVHGSGALWLALALAAMSQYVDTKLDLRTPNFDGTDSAWESWALKFEAYCELVGMTSQMEIAAAHDGPIDLWGMTGTNIKIT